MAAACVEKSCLRERWPLVMGTSNGRASPSPAAPESLRALFHDYGWTILRDIHYGPAGMASVLVMEKRGKNP